jgi:hypothetical protein
MRIGFISGDLVEIDNTRKGVSVPDYPVQGFLMRKWLERGHEVVLLTRYPKVDDVPEGITIDVAGNPMDHSLDVLFGDRLGTFGSEWDDTLRQIEQYHGPIVFHQYIAHSSWAPPFKEMPHLHGIEREWTIVNRSPHPAKCYDRIVGVKEKLPQNGVVRYTQWLPFLMLEYPWGGRYVRHDEVGWRTYRQGYYGRVPRTDKRARSVKRWLNAGDWSRIVYGPETTTAWLSAATTAQNGGRILHRDLPSALETFNVIVQSPIDRLRNYGSLGYWPHRIVECALAGVLQLFDPEIGIPEFREWRVGNESELRSWIERTSFLDELQYEVRKQQKIILPLADPVASLDRLDEILEDARHSY